MTDRFVEYQPQDAYGLLIEMSDPTLTEARPLGTCFALGHSNSFLTAKHCVPPEGPSGVFVQQRDGKPRPAVHIDRHPTADIARILTEPWATDPPIVFTDIENANALSLGDEICTYGFEINDPGNNVLTTQRFFRGYFQRLMPFKSLINQCQYDAGELSFPAPVGLSGAAVYKARRFPSVVAMVTENYESLTGTTHEMTELKEGDRRLETVFRKVVTYGIALRLSEIEPWLRNLTEGGPTAVLDTDSN
jgi:hypothetical protein